MAISDKLQELIEIKQDIKVAIENKGIDLTGVEFSDYAGKIDEIEPIVEHDVTFVWGHGIDDETDFVIDGTIIEAPEAQTVEGYDFIGWFNEGVEFDFNTPITESLVLVADWKLSEYTITFDSNGGNAQTALTLHLNDAITLPTPVREGYTFGGWLLDGNLFNLTTMPANNLALVADWEEEPIE